jgi:hypothetical protein
LDLSIQQAAGRQLIAVRCGHVAGLLIIPSWAADFAQAFFSLLSFTAGFITAEFLAANLALAVAVIVVMFWNFFVNRYWTYSDVE